ncbi:MAG: trypsin-like peptidase domain-containing protein [Anaerolineae bacterium]|nr:trypsin-like peptidase domain-containing protein [Anaerolineae bacterium]
MKQSRSLLIGAGVGAIVTVVLLLGIFAGGVMVSPYFNDSAQAAPLPQTEAPADVIPATDLVAAYEQTLIDVYQDNLASVVNVQVVKQINTSDLSRFDFFGSPDADPGATPDGQGDIPEFFDQRGGGSGFVWDTDGHIVTNYHVIADASQIEVIFADDTIVEAEVIGSDPDSDLAVLKIDVPVGQLQPVTLGDSDTLQVGQLAIAIGNPFGQEFTMTSGIISGVGRTIRGGNSGFSIPEVIQTDAPINPGNSGGPLLTRDGAVIGVNSQIISRSGGSSGIGFAVPVNIAKRVIPTLIEGGTVEYAWLGIQGNSVTTDAAEFRNIEPRGAMVLGVAEDGPAAIAGLVGVDTTLDRNDDAFRFGGDIITAINGEAIGDMNDLISYLLKETEPGDVVTLDVIHADGQQEQIEVELGVRPSSLVVDTEE